MSPASGLLSTLHSPQDLRALAPGQMEQLSAEIRRFLIENVSQTGGHLGPNLGVVELTIAMHRVFESPRDPFVFDTGHQSYVHKILTGRQGLFPTLRQRGGLAGYPSRAESEHDWVENSHASTALSYAEGLAKAKRLQGLPGTVVAFVGDGSLTGGMAWEALNNIAASDDLPLVVVVNDNGRSYTPTVGGLAKQLAALRTNPRYEQVLDVVKRSVSRAPIVGSAAYDILHGIKSGLKDVLAPQGMFSDLGLKYIGPIDGHDTAAVEQALQHARQYGGPVLVHALTHKGRGYAAAEMHEEDHFHAVGKINASTGQALVAATGQTWTDIFSTELVELGRRHENLVAVTAAMTYPTGLHRFQAAFPERTFDVGIAEQHAVTSAAGMAMGGLHPVIALYATFLNRAFDQVLLDVAMHRCGVTFVLDRAGVTGPDGASHHGMWDMSLLQLVPGLHLAAPRDGTRLREALGTAVTIDDAPSVVRYSKDAVPADLDAVDQVDGLDVLVRTEQPRVLVVGIGQLAGTAVAVGERLSDQGIGVTVVDPVWVLPVNPALVTLAGQHELVITVEDNGVVGGCGARLAQELRRAEVATPLREFGIAQEFLEHGSRAELLEDLGLTPQAIARYAVEAVLSHEPQPADAVGDVARSTPQE
ncbi:1-deoxy-D-xylulose-5-phosphate synthase [Friedmanniella luteola]|uniref:1-deoxy-D-xylulose-5-phosphate synthase n=1 Tax=Friedmanniella luteola TaxID=546871 RepID=A0A1H1S718_9ACTN|nr:1-deoxy-D-xylulose-5-phosphate synthase [Friedmanniella luteola]SDS43767.1 1-deoxy-D-xylulose-5-phosphate synthase [Friedmanniella luteola]